MIRSAAVVLLLFVLGFPPRVKAQEIETPKVELYGGHDYIRYNANPRINGVPPFESFSANGITGQAVYNPNSRFGIVSELTLTAPWSLAWAVAIGGKSPPFYAKSRLENTGATTMFPFAGAGGRNLRKRGTRDT